MANKNLINLENLLQVSRGNKEHMRVYLLQFQELIPQRMVALSKAMNTQNRKLIRQILHKMSPQLQFFGILGILPLIRRVENEYESMPFPELENLCQDCLIKLKAAQKEIGHILQNL